jgi:hypothetical protein
MVFVNSLLSSTQETHFTAWKRVNRKYYSTNKVKKQPEHLQRGDSFFAISHEIAALKDQSFPTSFSLKEIDDPLPVTLANVKGFYIIVLSPFVTKDEKEIIGSYALNRNYLNFLGKSFQDSLPVFLVSSNSAEHLTELKRTHSPVDTNDLHFISDDTLELAKKLDIGTFTLPEEKSHATREKNCMLFCYNGCILEAMHAYHADLMIEKVNEILNDPVERINKYNPHEATQLRKLMMIRKTISDANSFSALKDREILSHTYALDKTSEIDFSKQEGYYFLIFIKDISSHQQQVGNIIMQLNYLDMQLSSNTPRVFFVSDNTDDSIGDSSSFYFVEDPENSLRKNCGIDLIKINSLNQDKDKDLITAFDEAPTILFCHKNKVILGGKGDFTKFVDLAESTFQHDEEIRRGSFSTISTATSSSSSGMSTVSSSSTASTYSNSSQSSAEMMLKEKRVKKRTGLF